jgi:hypothetical protein
MRTSLTVQAVILTVAVIATTPVAGQERSTVAARQRLVHARAHALALNQLNDATVTLARVMEYSTSRDAYEMLSRLATAIDRLRDAYTGETRRETQRAAETAVLSPAAVVTPEAALKWRDAYHNAQAALARLIGPRDTDAVGTAGTRSTVTAGVDRAEPISEIPQPAVTDLQRLRSQLDQFDKLAEVSGADVSKASR